MTISLFHKETVQWDCSDQTYCYGQDWEIFIKRTFTIDLIYYDSYQERTGSKEKENGRQISTSFCTLFLKAVKPNTAAPEVVSSVLTKFEMAKKYCLQMGKLSAMFTLRNLLLTQHKITTTLVLHIPAIYNLVLTTTWWESVVNKHKPC